MVRKIVSAVILMPLGLVIVGLALANREVVTVSFDPFSATNPALAVRAPLFVLVFVLVIAGVIVGGIAAWLRQTKWRRAAPRLDAELRAARQDADRLRQKLAAREVVHSAGPSAPPLSLRPPAA
jgi:uncharacterized integral membrane protein